MTLAIVALVALPTFARPASAAQAQDASVNEIAGDPSAFYGQAVRVTGEVEDVLGPRAFTIEDDDLLFDEEVLIVSERPMLDREGRLVDPAALASDDVRVVGTVRPFDVNGFERQLGLKLDDSSFADWAGRPAIIARSIAPRPFTIIPPDVTVDQVTDDPSAFFGRTATVTGEIDEILESRSFTIDDNDLLADEELLVVTALPVPTADDRPANGRLVRDADVRVTGVVRAFEPLEIEREIGVDLDDSLHAIWLGRPVIVVRSIQAPTR